METTIEFKYNLVQQMGITSLVKEHDRVIEIYREILSLIEMITVPLSNQLKKIQLHAFRGLGLGYLRCNQFILGHYYLNYSKFLCHQLNYN